MSSPKEKAKELLEKCKMVYEDERGSVWNEISIHTWSKQCALIAVDEIFKVYELLDEDADIMFKTEINYWEEVKQEIEKL